MNTNPAARERDPVFAMSRVEVAKRLGCSRTVVAKIERRALAKVRTALAARGFKKQDFFDGPDD